jgi:hypothetical protein
LFAVNRIVDMKKIFIAENMAGLARIFAMLFFSSDANPISIIHKRGLENNIFSSQNQYANT